MTCTRYDAVLKTAGTTASLPTRYELTDRCVSYDTALVGYFVQPYDTYHMYLEVDGAGAQVHGHFEFLGRFVGCARLPCGLHDRRTMYICMYT